jgi:hypothetical protein
MESLLLSMWNQYQRTCRKRWARYRCMHAGTSSYLKSWRSWRGRSRLRLRSQRRQWSPGKRVSLGPATQSHRREWITWRLWSFLGRHDSSRHEALVVLSSCSSRKKDQAMVKSFLFCLWSLVSGFWFFFLFAQENQKIYFEFHNCWRQSVWTI